LRAGQYPTQRRQLDPARYTRIRASFATTV
jgi:hypothetical protein